MNTYYLLINITTREQLSKEQLTQIAYNMKSRLEGYYTKCPAKLKDADISISIANRGANNE